MPIEQFRLCASSSLPPPCRPEWDEYPCHCADSGTYCQAEETLSDWADHHGPEKCTKNCELKTNWKREEPVPEAVHAGETMEDGLSLQGN